MGQNQTVWDGEPSNAKSSPLLDREFGKYQLIDELGSGGMAVVYLAVSRGPSGFTKLVVLKMLRDPELTGDSEAESEAERAAWINMFLNEARLAARLNHPNVVQTLEAGEEQGRHLIVMEYLDGRSLQNILDRERELGVRLPLAARVRIVADALAGLHHAHELTDFDGSPLGVVHRDVSPHNIFVTFDGPVKVLDFGIAKLSMANQLTETGVLKGKIRYMSPEQAMGERIDRSTDVFAMGIVLWELLSERSLWQNQSDMQILQILLNDDPLPSVHSVNPSAPARLAHACMKALNFQREQRFQSCAEFRAELLECLELLPEVSTDDIGREVSSMFATLREKRRQAIAQQLAAMEVTQDAPELGVSPSSPLSQERPRRKQSRVGISLALVAVVAMGGAFALARRGNNNFRVDTTHVAPAALSPPVTPSSQPLPSLPPSPTLAVPTTRAAEVAPAVEAPQVESAASARKTSRSTRGRAASKEPAPPANNAEPATPPAPEVAAPNTGVEGSRLHLDTANPWSASAPPPKP